MPWRRMLCSRMPAELFACLHSLKREESEALEEIRIYLNRPAALTIAGCIRQIGYIADREKMDELLSALSGYALYRCGEQLAQGYLPLPGGHRAGVCGRMIREENGTVRLSGATSVCIRIARHIPGSSIPIRPYLLTREGAARRVLLVGAPGCGKTTVLRDAALYLSDEAGLHVAVADEREELFSSIPAQKGLHLDVLGGCEKARAMSILLRTMGPQVIVADEIGREEDADAALDAAHCGTGLLISAHADGLDAIKRRPVLSGLLAAGAFDCCIHIGRHGKVMEVWDAEYGHIQKADASVQA